MVFPVIMYGCDSWTVKKAEHQRIGALELCCCQTIESTLDSKKIKPVHPEGNQSWILIGRTEAEAPILWSPDTKSQPIAKDPDAGKYWGQENNVTEDEMVQWHHWLNVHKFEQTPGDSEGQGSLMRCSPCGCKELDMIEWLNTTTTQ